MSRSSRDSFISNTLLTRVFRWKSRNRLFWQSNVVFVHLSSTGYRSDEDETLETRKKLRVLDLANCQETLSTGRFRKFPINKKECKINIDCIFRNNFRKALCQNIWKETCWEQQTSQLWASLYGKLITHTQTLAVYGIR